MNKLLDAIIEQHRGHTNCETWKLLLEDSAQAAVNRTTGREWTQRRGWIQEFEGGHCWQPNDEGEIDMSAADGDYHNGPWCVRCDEPYCSGCNPNILTEKCPSTRVLH